MRIERLAGGQAPVEWLEACLFIARALPQHFTPQGLADMESDLRRAETYVATGAGETATATRVSSDQVIGFLSLVRKGPAVGEILWMAVRPDLHRQGIGSSLLRQASTDLSVGGVRILLVKTLSAKVDYKPYERTRGFYEKNGFLLIETIDPYPGWEAGNPCAIYAYSAESVHPFRRKPSGCSE